MRKLKETEKNPYFDHVAKFGKFRSAKKSECLYNLTLNNQYVYCLEEGLCALTSITKSGEEKIYHYFTSGSIIGFVPAFLPVSNDDTASAFSLITKTNCKVYEISYEEFDRLLRSDPLLGKCVVNILANNFNSVLSHFHFMQEADTPSRLCRTLLDFSDLHHGKLVVNKHFTYVELAKYLGVHTVTISRIMSALKNEGVITKDGHAIIIKDCCKLKAYAHGTQILSY